MEIGLIGLGKMGGNMAERLRLAGHKVVGFDFNPQATAKLTATGSVGVNSLEDLAANLTTGKRAIWIMVPAGDPVDETIAKLKPLMKQGDIFIDGGNSNYKDTIRRHDELKPQGFDFVDVGTSGGVWGLQEGYSLMIGGDEAPVKYLSPIFEALAPAPDKGWGHVGPTGSGHFTKMVHNGIEYGMMQAYAEGFALMRGKTEFDLDLAGIAEMWRHGSVVRSWLLDLSAEFLASDQTLEDIAPFVADSGEGRWTALEAIELGVPAPVMSLALMSRFASQGKADYASKLLSRMRQSFGGHAVKREKS